MERNARVYVAGHRGLIGSAIVRQLQAVGHSNVLRADRAQLDLATPQAVDSFFQAHRPDFVVLAAGKVGGIVENRNHPAEFITDNLAMQLNVIRAAHQAGVRRLVMFASSCMYPRDCPQPMAEDALLTGRPEPTSMAYAVAKLAGLQMCLAYNAQYGGQRFVPLIPNSAYGPNDDFDLRSAHVLSALVRRFHEAKQAGAPSVTLWGSGTPRREFVHADDIAEAVLMLLERDLGATQLPLNLGTGRDHSIRELADVVRRIVGYTGEVLWDTSKPDGAPRKLLDSSRLRALGWRPRIDLEEGVRATYRWFLENAAPPTDVPVAAP